MRQRLSAESVIAASVASFRNTKTSAHEIAKTIIRDLQHFGYHIHSGRCVEAVADQAQGQDASESAPPQA